MTSTPRATSPERATASCGRWPNTRCTGRPVAFQSDHVEDYRAALAELGRQDLCFRCICSRKDLRGHRIYPGTCRTRSVPPGREAAVRILVPDADYAFQDRLQGGYAECLARATGDFIVARRDGLTAYQLAVVTGAKLSKRTAASTIGPGAPERNLQWTLQLLGLDPPRHAAPEELLAWAVPRWDTTRLPKGARLTTWTSL